MKAEGVDQKVCNLGVLLLAAGASSRMGSPKQLLPWKNQPLVRYITNQALSLPCRPVLVITGSNAEKVSAVLMDTAAEIIFCEEWDSGMGHSLACGISALEKLHPNVLGVMVLLADQPMVDKAYMEQLCIHFFKQDSRGIVASRYGQVLGPPLIFSRDFFAALQNLSGDRGAKDLLIRHASQVLEISFPEGLLDWDTPEDVARSENPHAD
jgi:molybdenum cofactor cytidylyltransferase